MTIDYDKQIAKAEEKLQKLKVQKAEAVAREAVVKADDLEGKVDKAQSVFDSLKKSENANKYFHIMQISMKSDGPNGQPVTQQVPVIRVSEITKVFRDILVNS